MVVAAAGPVTVTVAVAVRSPPAPLAVSVYVVVFGGIIRRLPLACTVPMPLLIETFGRSGHTSTAGSADCPRSMAGWLRRKIRDHRRLPVARMGSRGRRVPAGAGGGGGGIGVFLLHAEAKKTRTSANDEMPAYLVAEISNRNGEVIFHNYLTPHTGDLLAPCFVNCFTCVPSASIV